jgi:hypothetical protein
LQLLIRHRRDLVRKGAALNCQIRDHLEAARPGYLACFDKPWDSAIPWHLLRHFPSAEQLHVAGLTSSVNRSARPASASSNGRCRPSSTGLQPRGGVAADQHRRLALALYDDRQRVPEIRPATRTRRPLG